MKLLSKAIFRLKAQIHEKKNIIDEHVSVGGWNDEWRAKEYKELNTFYDAYFSLLEAHDFIEDQKKQKEEQKK